MISTVRPTPVTSAAATGSIDLAGARVHVCGHTGMVGRALLRRLAPTGATILTKPRRELDLTRQADVEDYLASSRPDAVIVAAGKVGGIGANTADPTGFLATNLAIALNVIVGAAQAGVPRLLYLGSNCMYPREAPQPIREDALLSGPLEPTNEGYALAKIAGLKLAAAYNRQHGLDYITAIPANLYGPEDSFEPATSHVIGGLIRRLHEAKQAGAPSIPLWGTGIARRSFLHVDDCADALVFLLAHYHAPEPVNVATAGDISILELAHLIADIVGYRGALTLDPTKPDGMLRKGLDGSRLAALGWTGGRPLRQGLAETYAGFLAARRTDERMRRHG